jgi:hypothetical protein
LLEFATNRRPLIKYSLPQIEVVGLSFLEFHSDKIALTAFKRLAPLDFASEKKNAWAIG